jgi:hypothetical protein
MGSGSGKGTSRSSSASSSNTTVNTDNRVYQSDFGAVKAGTDVAAAAVTGAVDIGKEAIDLGRAGLDAGTDNLNLGLGFAADTYGGGLDFASRIVDQLFSFTETAIDTAGSQARSLASDSVAGYQALARNTSESADDKVVKIGAVALAAVAAIFVLPAVFGKR